MPLTKTSVKTITHPLVQQLLTKIRDYQSLPGAFRQYALQLSNCLMYEALSDLQTQPASVETPLEGAIGTIISDYVIFAPVLRAGLVLAEAAQVLMPDARIYHIGLKRDEKTLKAISYYALLPEALPPDSRVYVLDPMLATGGSATAAISLFADRGVNNIYLVSLVAAPEGIKKVLDTFPQVKIITASIDDHLNEHGYIVPGLGDAGDRLFGT